MMKDAARTPLGRRIVGAMTERLGLKAAAIFFACVLWLVVSAEEPTEQVVEIAVVPRLDSTLALVGRRPVVRALIIGRARDLLELAGDPPIARPAVDASARDSVVVTIQPSDIELNPETPVIVREVRPRSVVLQVARVSRPTPPVTQAESVLAGLITLPSRTIDTETPTVVPQPEAVIVDTVPPPPPRPAPAPRPR